MRPKQVSAYGALSPRKTNRKVIVREQKRL